MYSPYYMGTIEIGSNVMIGADCIIMYDVKIGDNCVIAAGSVVTKDVPSGVVAAGNPCKILREISENDRIYYYKNKKIDLSMLK